MRAGSTGDVVRLLDEMTDGERRACFPELQLLRKELRADLWSGAARRACPALQVAGAGCQTGAAAVATWLSANDMRWWQAASEVLLDVLGDRDPTWLADLAHRLAGRPMTARVPYALMAGLVRLSGCAVPTTEAYVHGWLQDIGSIWPTGDTVTDRLRKDPHLAELVAALFETRDVGGWLGWPDEGPNSWTYALPQLTREGRLDRVAVVDACVARLLRGGRPADQRAFLKLLTALDLGPDEQRARIADWIALCSDAPSTVAAHAQSVLGTLALDGELAVRDLAEASVAVLFRSEKKLVRAQLVLLGKILGRDPSGADELLPAVAQAFGHDDTDTQKRALKLVERHLGDLDTLGDSARVRAELVDATTQLSPGLRQRAEQLLDVAPQEPVHDAHTVHEEVLPPAPRPTRLAPAPRSAAELAEEVGALLAADGDVSAFERALDGLVRHAHQDSAGLIDALRPVVARCWWYEPDQLYIGKDNFFRESPHGLEVVLAALFDEVSTETLHRAVSRGSTYGHCPHSGLSRAVEARLWEAAYRIRTQPLPFLLATPTWSTGLLEPDELIARLDAYNKMGVRPGPADLAQALLRVRRDDRAAAEDAARAARKMGTAEADRLARWLTTAEPSPSTRRRTSGPRILLEFGEVPVRHADFPPEFRHLWQPVSFFTNRWHCRHWDESERQHWTAVVPGRPELVAGRLLRDISTVAVDDSRGGTAVLPALAEAHGEPGEAVHLGVAYGLGARHPEDRLAAVDALLVLAARGRLDADRLAADLGELMQSGAVKPLRLAEAIRTAAATGAYATLWSVLRGTLPILLAPLAADGAVKPVRGLGDLLAVAAECAERSGARGDLPHLGRTADRRGSSRLVTEARRLRDALGQGAMEPGGDGERAA
ncbi:hypothetical protein GCM10010365_54530 [Streptomyces poonensis]|uniref:DUF7824 domain-containing protein n=1 Tax=Streptomyces poonensis TaxID=68255 RepID=A0A918PZC1_9ACTN|nr:hypothetical protein GCM10010365_54530 [Streptomyces poonensis]GLJ89683.1 hypothetical protein GCM10017589_22840 [Streptomyces poonensis]